MISLPNYNQQKISLLGVYNDRRIDYFQQLINDFEDIQLFKKYVLTKLNLPTMESLQNPCCIVSFSILQAARGTNFGFVPILHKQTLGADVEVWASVGQVWDQ